MKLFFRDKFLIIAVQAVQLIIILSIFWLDGYRDVKMFLYVVFLNFFILSCYLVYHYFNHRTLYRLLENPIKSIEDSFQKTSETPLASALENLLREHYRLFQSQLRQVENQQEEHRKFMDQWVHQMKTPLSVIELTAQGLDEPDSSSIREETDRMKTGLNTVLYMARLRTIEQDFHIKPVVLAKIVHEVNGENKRFYIRNQVYPKLEEAKAGITVETDEKWLFFILSQLIQNAVKYSQGKSNRIIISIYERDEEAVLEVTDFGIGIPVEDRRRIFNPFYTGENGRKFRESTGMGLYLTKETANYLGHQIEIDSEVGKGSTFRVIFTKTQNLNAVH